MSLKIYIDTLEKVSYFISDVTRFDSDVDLCRDSHVVDAKSIIAIFTMDITKPFVVKIHSDNEEELKRFKFVMQKYQQ